ncbi:MAG: NADPH:quinone reductase [Gammaproteobacteria bacterium]|nr:NADPH:quinone reductase [Gammaproteobacteria bacterium]
MQAVWYERFGPAGECLQFGAWETPAPGHGEVLVRLHASGVNPSDAKKRAGITLPNLLDAGPVIPHSDGAGVIEAVGPGVSAARMGERVWVYNAQHRRRCGTAAQYVALPAAFAVPLPDNVDFATGAGLGIPAMTAHRAVTLAGPVAERTVLVTGGAGRVGYYAIQFAKLRGARVIATASSATSRADCHAAGADWVIDHPNANTAAEVLDLTRDIGVDLVVEGEFGGNFNVVLDAIRTGGTIATYASMAAPTPTLPFYRMMYKDLSLRWVFMYEMPATAMQQAIDDISAALARGQLLHRIAARFPLAETAAAHALIETGTARGGVVVETV